MDKNHDASPPASPDVHVKETSTTNLEAAAVDQLMQTIKSSAEARRLLSQLRQQQQQDDSNNNQRQSPSTPSNASPKQESTTLMGLERSMRALVEARREIGKIQGS